MNTYHLAPTLSPAPRILIIEDDVELCTHLSNHLSRRGFALNSTQCGDQGLDLALHSPVELILLDIMLPNESGLNILARLRHARGTPVILMSALGAEQDRITGFSQGADDYLPKPFSLAELDVRIDALLRRVAIDCGVAKPLARHSTSGLDSDARDFTCNGRAAGLTASEFRLLCTLHAHRGETLSKAFLYQQVLHRPYTRLDRGLDVHVCNLRRKLAAIDVQGIRIDAVRHQGYVLLCDSA
ncbi:response regulator transcription factor [Pseudomonas marginalis]|uniref:response regulator transcription factor n=1 Tax=Pseudomonas TaxID=286 RepID=UPI000D3736C6|nr:response regulator transcription factor [Pseudomonas sp. GV047]